MNNDLRSGLERAGWYFIGQRQTGTGLTLYKLGRDPQTSPLGRFYDYEEERSAEDWMIEIAAAPVPMGFVVQERMKLSTTQA